MCVLVLPKLVPFKMAKQGANKLADAALACWHHALQTHNQVSVVLGMEDHQLVLPWGHTHARHLEEKSKEREGQNRAQSNKHYSCFS